MSDDLLIRYVYVAGPYTKPNPNHNTRRAIDAADRLLAVGYIPYLPHLTHLWDTVSPHDYEDWMRLDLAWIERCDALVRLPGESAGADREEAHAVEHGIPVYALMDLLSRKAPESALMGAFAEFIEATPGPAARAQSHAWRTQVAEAVVQDPEEELRRRGLL